MGPPITDIVVLGLGSLDPDADGGDRRASHVQLAALGAMLEGLADAQQADVGIEDRTSEVHDAVGSNASNETATTVFTVNITYQDPAFTLVDTAFLSRPELYLPASLATGSSPVAVQASVVPSPEAFELVAKPRTLLLGIHLYTDVLAAAVATGLPEVYVGTGWEVYEAARWSVASGAPLKRPGRANRRHRRCSGRKNAEYETREDDPSLEDEIKELGWLPKLDPRFGFMEKIPLPATGKEWEDVFEPTGIYWRTDKV